MTTKDDQSQDMSFLPEVARSVVLGLGWEVAYADVDIVAQTMRVGLRNKAMGRILTFDVPRLGRCVVEVETVVMDATTPMHHRLVTMLLSRKFFDRDRVKEAVSYVNSYVKLNVCALSQSKEESLRDF